MKRRVPIILLGMCAALFVVGVVQLFQLRFERGDVYPPYSTLRADPLGSMALYESLDRMPEVAVSRDFSSRNALEGLRDTTYLHLAAEPRDWRWMSETAVVEMETFMKRGGRLVVTCNPETSGNPYSSRYWNRGTNSPSRRVKKDAPTEPNRKADKAKDEDGAEESEADEDTWETARTDLRIQWGFDVAFERLKRDESDVAQPSSVTNCCVPQLPASLAWHSSILFKPSGTNWQVIYARGTNAVLMERRFGKGSLVFASDSFFLSNEAMLQDRQPELLAWLVGGSRNVMFDEAHLGVVEEPGVTTLMRRYRLHGVVAGLAVLLGLFVWRNTSSLVPLRAEERGGSEVVGRDSTAGFVNLLRRSIPSGDILKVCFEQWEKTAATRRDLAPSRVQQARQRVTEELARTGRDRNPVAAYQEVARILKPGRPANSAGPANTSTETSKTS